FICCPIDEVDQSCKEFGVKVYAAVKAAGMKTYATKDPTNPDAAAYAPYLDIWCSQPYSVPYEQIVAQKRGRSVVTCTGLCAGDRSVTRSGIRAAPTTRIV
ncbi:MAG TPA: hypothetical protein PLQ76_04570, partial [bacterium]|nr:hypothetical protein [bacterium]